MKSLSSVLMQALVLKNNRLLNHSKKRSYIVTQSIKKLPEEYRTLALNKKDPGASQTIKRSI